MTRRTDLAAFGAVLGLWALTGAVRAAAPALPVPAAHGVTPTPRPALDAPAPVSSSARSRPPLAQGVSGSAGVKPSAPLSTAWVYRVDPSQSSARFIVRARSFFMPETVHGRGGAISGQIRVGTGSAPPVTGSLAIVASTLKSGVRARDAKMRDVLRVKKSPLITFTITGVDPFKTAALDAGGLTVTAHGILSVAGMARPLSFPVFARREAQGSRLILSGTAVTGFKDFKLNKPGVGFLVAVRDQIEAGADIVAQRIR